MTRERIENHAWYQANVIKTTPVERLGRPEDIAGAAAFLCSEDASFIAGQVLVVDGGWLAGRYLPVDG
jgi:NAD(P)-dependent dehydrogenase (short-subunit alcohol dehydrogenase family)